MHPSSNAGRLRASSSSYYSDGIEETGSKLDHDVGETVSYISAAANSAQQQVLHALATQRALQRQQLVSRHLVRWRIRHAAKNTSTKLEDSFLRALSAHDTSARQCDAWEGDHGASEAVSTAVEHRLKHLQAVVVPTAIKQHQEVSKLLQDRHVGLINKAKARWESFKDAHRLRRLASSSKLGQAAGRSASSSAAAAALAGGAAATTTLPQGEVGDPLTRDVRGAGRQFKLTKWMGWLGFTPGDNPYADVFWLRLERQWQMPPFSTAVQAAREHRQQREGAGWCGGPKTEAGVRALEELQLRHLLAEQQQALRRLRLRLLLSRLPGLGRLDTVPLVTLLAAGSSRSVLEQAGSSGAVLQTREALDAVHSNIEQLQLLQSNRSAAWLQGCTAPDSFLDGPGCDNGSMPGWQQQQHSSRTNPEKQRLAPAEVALLRQQQRIQLMHGTLPALAQQAMDKQLLLDLQRMQPRQGFGTLAAAATAAAGGGGSDGCGDSDSRCPSSSTAAGAAVPATGTLAALPKGATTGTAAAFGPIRRATEGGAEPQQQQDEGDQGWECIGYDAAQLKRCGLLEAAAQMWQEQHEAQLERRLQLIAMAEACFRGPEATGSQPHEDGVIGTAPEAQQLHSWQQQHQPVSAPGSVTEEVAPLGAAWLDKYAHRIRNQSAQAKERHRANLREGLHALRELFSGPPIWRDVAAAGPLIEGSVEGRFAQELFTGAATGRD